MNKTETWEALKALRKEVWRIEDTTELNDINEDIVKLSSTITDLMMKTKNQDTK